LSIEKEKRECFGCKACMYARIRSFLPVVRHLSRLSEYARKNMLNRLWLRAVRNAGGLALKL
jgi:hypothetical protein